MPPSPRPAPRTKASTISIPPARCSVATANQNLGSSPTTASTSMRPVTPFGTKSSSAGSINKTANHATHLGHTVSWRVPLAGRSRETHRLRELVEAAERGNGSVCVLKGPHGIGKSRLSRELSIYAEERGWTALRGRANPSERLVPFSPFGDALLPLLHGTSPRVIEALCPGADALTALQKRFR